MPYVILTYNHTDAAIWYTK